MQFNIELQIIHQLTNDNKLLKVFLTEVRLVGLNDVKQLRHDKRNTAEVTRPELPFHDLVKVTEVEFQKWFLAVHFFVVGSEERITSGFGECSNVLVECSRVFFQVSRIVELRGIDIDRTYRGRILLP